MCGVDQNLEKFWLWNLWPAYLSSLQGRDFTPQTLHQGRNCPGHLKACKSIPRDLTIDGNQGNWPANLGMRDPFPRFQNLWLKCKKFAYLSSRISLAWQKRKGGTPCPETPPIAQPTQAVRTTFLFRLPQGSAAYCTPSTRSWGLHYPMSQASCPSLQSSPSLKNCEHYQLLKSNTPWESRCQSVAVSDRAIL